METEANPYSSPDAELGPADHQHPQPEQVDPTGFADTARLILDLVPKTGLRLMGYYVLWMIVHMVLVGGIVTVAGMGGFLGARETGGALIVLGIILAVVVAVVVAAYFWGLKIRHVDNRYTGRSTKGEFSQAKSYLATMAGTFVVKGVAVAVAYATWFVVVAILMQMDSAVLLVFGFAAWGLVVLGGYMFVHFAEFAVVVHGCSVGEAFNRAMDIVRGLENWLFALAWAVLAGVVGFVVTMVVFFVSGMAIALLEPTAPLLATVVGAGIQLCFALVVLPVFVVTNYAVYRALCAKKRQQRGW